ncbi:nucleotidyl transferase AbiEii/AbiGii toxin family protein (plasmid) [Paraburkholderia sp. PREW-6R]|uniref:nucleotidyl transferase AbiEii/AbiGii toxin family protein n=1 Tax=Paraburkholderia sp. PREW-6R TaxID=3141544 RepID=UPI0031F4F1D3
MTNTSPPSSLEVSNERPLRPETRMLLRHVRAAAGQLQTDFVVAGATARDLTLWHVYGIQAERRTFDVDVAISVVNWDAHAALVELLRATGYFTPSSRDQHAMTFEDPDVGPPVPLDLVPFGGVEAPEGEIAWPPKGDFIMNVLGFREAVDTAIRIDVGEGVVVPVVALPALAILKMLAWHDRRLRANKDAFDLLLLLRNYLKAGNGERIWTVAGDLLETYDFDVDLAASALLGRDARAIARPETLAAVIPLLADDRTYDTLRRDMLARAAAQMFEDFADGSDVLLAAFRAGFLG